MPVTLTGRLICACDADSRTVADALPEHTRLSLAEPGCQWFEVTQDPDDPLIWRVSEGFDDRAAFEAHQTRTRDSGWFAATSHIERRYGIAQ